MVSNQDVKALADMIRHTIHLEDASLSDSFYYSSLVLCVIDSVFSIGVRYESTKNVVARYCHNANVPLYRQRSANVIDEKAAHTIGDFIRLTEGTSFDVLADQWFGNRQRTSSRNGILKAQAVHEFALVLDKYGVQTFNDVTHMYTNPAIEKEILSIKGQKSGLSLSYFYMLAGNDDMIKADRHICNYIENATGKAFTKQEEEELVAACVEMLSIDYPQVTCRLLDHAIWSFMARG